MRPVVLDADQVARLDELAWWWGTAREWVALAGVALLLRRYTGVAERVLRWPGGTVLVDLTTDLPVGELSSRLRPVPEPDPVPGEPTDPFGGTVECELDVTGAHWSVTIAGCPAELAESVQSDLTAVFAALAADPAARTEDLLPVAAYERARPVVAAPDPAAVRLAERIAAHQSIPAAFADQAARHPDRPAVLADDACLTYRELAGAAAATAAALGRGGPVALLCRHGATTVTALLAALAAGRIYLPLDPGFPVQRLLGMLADSAADVVLVDAEHQDLAARLVADSGRDGIRIVHIRPDGGESPAAVLAALRGVAQPDDPAYLLYTSGSTGTPKGVLQSHRNVLFGIANHVRNFAITPDDRTSVLTSFGFDMAVTDTFGAILSGAAAVPLDIRSAGLGRVLSTLDRHRVSIVHSTPTVYRYLLASLGQTGRLPHVRAVLLGGEEVTRHDAELARRHFAEDAVFVNGYGTTEISFAAQYHLDRDAPLDHAVVPVGHPLDGVEIVLLDQAGRPTCLTGEVLVRCRHVALGYWRRPELTADRFVQHRGVRAYRTGDLARRLPDGRLSFLGRTDRLVKIRGYRVELGEVESVLAARPEVGRAAVVARPNPSGEREIVGYAVPAAGHRIDPTAVRSALAAALPDFMVPRAVVVLDELPMGATGKLDQSALPPPPAPPPAPVPSSVDEDDPAGRLERIIGATWCEVLGVAEVDRHASFVDLGGHSLHMGLVQQRLEQTLGTSVPLARLFEFATVARLADYLRTGSATRDAAVSRAADRMRRRKEARR